MKTKKENVFLHLEDTQENTIIELNGQDIASNVLSYKISKKGGNRRVNVLLELSTRDYKILIDKKANLSKDLLK